MKKILILGTCFCAAAAANAQTTIFDHTFDGSGTQPLGGTAEDYSGVEWSTGGIDGTNFIFADGSTDSRAGAMLAYEFTSGMYEITARTVNSDTFLGIGVTTSSPAEGSYVTNSSNFGTFAVRSGGAFTFWEGAGNANSNSGGSIGDYIGD